MGENFCNLHVHDEYSFLDGFGKSAAYAKAAKECGQLYLAQTNHGNVDGAITFQNECRELGIKPIIGCEAYIVPDATIKEKGEWRGHVTLLVKNQEGWVNLLQMLTYAHLEGFYNRPRIDYKCLLERCKGLVIMTACVGTFLKLPDSEELLVSLAELNPGDVYLEVMPHNDPEKKQEKTNRLCLELKEKYDLPLVATNDCHYVEKDHQETHEVLLAMQSKKKWKDPKRFRFTFTGLYLRDSEEMWEEFKKQDILDRRQVYEALANTIEIAKKCADFEIKRLEVHLPKVPGYEDRDENELFLELCEKGFNEKIETLLADVLNSHGPEAEEEKRKEYRDRFEDEYKQITELGFSRYFLIVWELVDWCRRNDIMVGPGRGSTGGSLLAYLLGITSVDPIPFGLIFSRFISPARIDLPDIDIDFEDRKRWMIRKHLEDVYGEYHVAGVSTFAKMKGRGALRDVCRIFDVPQVDVNKAANCIVVRSSGDLRADFTVADAFETFEDGIAFKKKYDEVTNYVVEVEGQVKGIGQHAAAMIVSSDDLREGKRAYLKLGKAESELNVNWAKEDAEYMGLMKLDILGLNALTVLAETRKAIKENHGVDIDYEKLPLNDEEVFKQFTLGNCVGCFQFGSLGLRKYCQEIKIDNFEVLAAASALFRPGTLRSGMTHEFVMRKMGKKWDVAHELVGELTKETYGILLYQEQVMMFMFELAGLGWKTADNVRKVISKTKGVEEFNKYKDEFVNGCLKKGTLTEEKAEEVWETASAFGHYGFNKSHAVEYSMISYWDMWLKVHYPSEFISCNLTYGSAGKKDDYVQEARRLGLDIMLPKVGISKSREWMTVGKKLYIPFIELKGIGPKTADKLDELVVKKGNGFFKKESGPRIGAKIEKIFDEIDAYNQDTDFDDGMRENVQNLFQFSIARDRMSQLRKLKDLLDSRLHFGNLGEIDFSAPTKDKTLYFGQMTEIKYGYRGKLVDLTQTVSGIGGGDEGASLGGVYGNFKDDTDFAMLIFEGKIYNKKKYKVEHCVDEWMIGYCNNPHKHTSSIHCHNAWIGDELVKGELEGLDLELIDSVVPYKNRQLLRCRDCELVESCREPVRPSSGRYNVMIIGEAPGKDEDRVGEGFVGKAGRDILWPELAKHGYGRRQFHVTNVVKCWPQVIKNPKGKHIKACEQWIKDEIDYVKPFLILAFGNTCLNYFKGKDSGIMEMSGITEWDNTAAAWVTWCIHPASILYGPENRELFVDSIREFVDKLEILGGLNSYKRKK